MTVGTSAGFWGGVPGQSRSQSPVSGGAGDQAQDPNLRRRFGGSPRLDEFSLFATEDPLSFDEKVGLSSYGTPPSSGLPASSTTRGSHRRRSQVGADE